MRMSLAALKTLDGSRVALAFQRSVEDCVLDMRDRPLDKSKRKVTLELELIPVADEDPVVEGRMMCVGADANFRVKTSLPQRVSKTYNFELDDKGLFFAVNSPENAAQTTFDDVDQETGRVERGEPVEE
jgi:hypothetical protein